MKEIYVPETLTRASLEQFAKELSVASSSSTQAVLLNGSAHAFCRGMDFDDLVSASDQDKKTGVALYSDLLQQIATLPRIVICQVEGDIQAGGVGICAASDWVLAAETARVSLPECLFGLVPAMVFPYLSARVGAHRAKRMSLMVESLSAHQALDWGLIDEVCGANQLQEAMGRRLKQLARVNIDSVAAMKKFYCVQQYSDTKNQAMDLTAELISRSDVLERIRLYVQDGVPPWTLGSDQREVQPQPEGQKEKSCR